MNLPEFPAWNTITVSHISYRLLISLTVSDHAVVTSLEQLFPQVMTILQSSDYDVTARCLSAWLLGNIALDREGYRELILSNGSIVPSLFALLDGSRVDTTLDTTNTTSRSIIAWSLCCLIRGHGQYSASLIGK